MQQKLTISLALLIALNCFAQNSRINIEGKVRHDSVFLKDVQIVNLTTKFGTISNEKGTFQINVKLGDQILFKSIAYTSRTIKITDTHIKNKQIIVYLDERVNELDEVFIQKIELDIKNAAVHKNAQFDKDYIDMQKPPDARALTDPTYTTGFGLNALGLVAELHKLIFKNKIELKRNIREKERKNKIKQNEFITHFHNLYDKKFYFQHLNIQEDEFYRFIDYCEGNGLENYFDKNELEIKDFLIKQAKVFNEIKD